MLLNKQDETPRLAGTEQDGWISGCAGSDDLFIEHSKTDLVNFDTDHIL